jgi:hypothetical protein
LRLPGGVESLAKTTVDWQTINDLMVRMLYGPRERQQKTEMSLECGLLGRPSRILGADAMTSVFMKNVAAA